MMKQTEEKGKNSESSSDSSVPDALIEENKPRSQFCRKNPTDPEPKLEEKKSEAAAETAEPAFLKSGPEHAMVSPKQEGLLIQDYDDPPPNRSDPAIIVTVKHSQPSVAGSKSGNSKKSAEDFAHANRQVQEAEGQKTDQSGFRRPSVDRSGIESKASKTISMKNLDIKVDSETHSQVRGFSPEERKAGTGSNKKKGMEEPKDYADDTHSRSQIEEQKEMLNAKPEPHIEVFEASEGAKHEIKDLPLDTSECTHTPHTKSRSNPAGATTPAKG